MGKEDRFGVLRNQHTRYPWRIAEYTHGGWVTAETFATETEARQTLAALLAKRPVAVRVGGCCVEIERLEARVTKLEAAAQ